MERRTDNKILRWLYWEARTQKERFQKEKSLVAHEMAIGWQFRQGIILELMHVLEWLDAEDGWAYPKEIYRTWATYEQRY